MDYYLEPHNCESIEDIREDIRILTAALNYSSEHTPEPPTEDPLACLQRCHQLNRERQEVLSDLLQRIEKMKARSAEQEIKARRLLNTNPHAYLSRWTRDHVKHFYKPYFKDDQGFPPPRNPDTIEKLRNGVPDLAAVRSVSKWQRWEMKLLDDAVRKNAYLRLLEPLTARKKRLQEQLKALANRDHMTGPHIQCNQVSSSHEQIDLEQRLCNTQKQIDTLTGEPLMCMLTDPLANIDWMHISATDFQGRRSDNDCLAMWSMCLRPGVNRSPWTKEETDRLMELARQHQLVRWDDVAKSLVSGRTSYQCFLHYQVTLNRTRTKWTPLEDRRLKFLVRKFRRNGNVPFNQLARHMPGRTAHALRLRWSESVDPAIRRGRFSLKEDLLLATARHLHDMSFRQISSLIPGRTETQLRNRYNCLENVHPTLPFTPEEDRRLVHLAQQRVSELSTWSVLVRDFPDRTRHQLRARYMRLLRNAKSRSNLVTHFCADKGTVWQQLKHKIEVNPEINSLVSDTLSLVSQVNKRPRRVGRKVKQRDAIDLEIAQIFRSHYAQPKGRRKKVYKAEDVAMLGSKARQIAEVLRANLNWRLESLEPCEDEGQWHMLQQLRAHHKAGFNCAGVELRSALSPNVTTLVGLRTLLLVEPFVLRWSFQAAQQPPTSSQPHPEASQSQEVAIIQPPHTTPQAPAEEETLEFAQACQLFKQRCLALFLWPVVLSQQQPPRLLVAAQSRVQLEVKKPVVPKVKMTKLQRKRWLKTRWQNYHQVKPEEPTSPVEKPEQQSTKSSAASSTKQRRSSAVVELPKSKSTVSSVEGKRQKGGVRNPHGKHMKR